MVPREGSVQRVISPVGQVWSYSRIIFAAYEAFFKDNLFHDNAWFYKITDIWDVTLCSLVGRYQRFGETLYLHRQGWVLWRKKIDRLSIDVSYEPAASVFMIGMWCWRLEQQVPPKRWPLTIKEHPCEDTGYHSYHRLEILESCSE
jgi:hypothetical protein